jgi:glycosyltransferase involved in cell wall biosynthesis
VEAFGLRLVKFFKYMQKVTLITVCFNSENTIRNTIESVLSQNYYNIEYIIIDGGSKDNTINIIREYKNKNIIFFSENDDGIYYAMNKGLRLASGDIVGIINSDDVYTSECIISDIVDKFSEFNVDAVYGNLQYFNGTTKCHIWRSSDHKLGSFSRGWHPPHTTLFVKRDIYLKYGDFNCEFKVSADFELMLRFFERYQISSYFLDKILVNMRLGGESNKNFRNILIGNLYILLAFHKNKILVNYFMYPILRIFPKLVSRIKFKFF